MGTKIKKPSVMPALLMGLLAIFALNSSAKAQTDISVQEKEVLQAVEKVAPTVEEVAKKLWDLSEVSLLELKSSAYLKDLLKKNGFAITSEKTASVPTAFVAEYGKGEPIIGILLEYDALPGLGIEAVQK
jgi:aminobenzoyl-glutamate utilization protein B